MTDFLEVADVRGGHDCDLAVYHRIDMISFDYSVSRRIIAVLTTK